MLHSVSSTSIALYSIVQFCNEDDGDDSSNVLNFMASTSLGNVCQFRSCTRQYIPFVLTLTSERVLELPRIFA